MVIEIYGITPYCDEEIHVGRSYVDSVTDAERITTELTELANKIDVEDQFICEYRWEESKKKVILRIEQKIDRDFGPYFFVTYFYLFNIDFNYILYI